MSSADYAIAIDLGTTTIAAALVERSSGRLLATAGRLNPQRQFGQDLVTRLDYASRTPDNLRRLQRLVNDELAAIVAALLADAAVERDSVGQLAVAGNPGMSQLLLGLPVTTLVRPPYRPLSTAAYCLTSGELGWETDLPLYLFPSPGGFVGGDMVAFLFGLGADTDPFPFPEPTLFLDFGTNGELALRAGGRLLATSVAAGPAFEGGNLACGMAALPGAIDGVAAGAGKLVLRTVGGRPPLGICGSGVLDALALLLATGLVDRTGGFLDPERVASPLGSRLEEVDGQRQFVLYRDATRTIALTQNDIRQVQLAKGAVRAGMEVLFARAGVAAADVATVVLTGSFGAALSLESLKSVGVLTENMVRNARFVREGALAGVSRYLLSADAAAAVDRLAAALRVVPLSGTPAFEQRFIGQLDFP